MISPTTSRGGIFCCRLPYYTRRSAAGRFVGSGLDRSAGRQKIASLPYCVCRGDHWSPAHLPPQRIFRDSFLARQTGTGEQCSPLQAFFDSPAGVLTPPRWPEGWPPSAGCPKSICAKQKATTCFSDGRFYFACYRLSIIFATISVAVLTYSVMLNCLTTSTS